jgi:hypothetical protein
MPIELPTQKSKPKHVDPRVLIIYSPPKAGKTTLLSKLDNCLIIDLENGTDYLECLKINVNNYRELEEVFEALKKNNPYKYIAIDTITKMEDWAEMRATFNYKGTNMGKNFQGQSVLQLTSPNGFSPGYLWLRQAFNKYIDQFASLGSKLILVAHLREKEIEKDSKMVSAKDLDLAGKSRSYTCANADAIGYVYRDVENKMMINFKSAENVICGSRCEHLAGQKFEFSWDKIYTELKTNNL